MTSIYLTSAAADAAVTVGSGTKWKAGWAAGASSTLLNKNTSAAPASALQVTDSATAGTDGTVVSWYTEPLWGVTIAGQITCLVWDRESATAANVAPTIRIERCSGDGTVLSTIVAENTNLGAGEMPTTAGGATDTITCSAANVTDTTLSDGDRLRITLWIDNAADQGGTGTMASGNNAQFYVNGPVGAAGQSQLTFTEVVHPLAGPQLVTSPETSFTTTTTPKTLTAVGALSGDLLVALYGGDNFSGAASSATVATTGGTTSAWTEVLEALVGNASSPWKSNAWADVTANGDATASLARVQGTAQVWGGWLAHIRNHGGIGNTAELVDSATDVVSLTTSANSMVVAIGIDWDHISPVTAFVPSGAHDIERNAGLAAVTWYAGFWVGQAAGTRNYGIATNSSAHFSWTVIEILAAPSGASLTLGLVSETDLAFSLIPSKAGALGLATSSETALSLSETKSRVLGLTQEADLALPLVPAKSAGLGIPAEVDVALALGFGKTRTFGLAVEGDVALGLVPTKIKALALVTETDLALTLSMLKTKVLGLPTESDVALALILGGFVFGLITETDSVFPLANATKSKGLGLVASTDSALALDRQKARELGLVAEQDETFALLFAKALALGLAIESGITFSLEFTSEEEDVVLKVYHNGVPIAVQLDDLKVVRHGVGVPVVGLDVV